MPDSGVLVIGDQIIGYSERYIYVNWDIAPDVCVEVQAVLEMPYLGVSSVRYVYHEHVKYSYSNKWCSILYTPIPVSDRYIYLKYALHSNSERYAYYDIDTSIRYCFCESLLTQTPLLLKYPKYINWEFIPQIINPEFKIWSHYELDEDNISLHLTSDNGVNIFLNSGVNKSIFNIVKNSDKVYTITCYVDHVFSNDETITCYLTLFDKKGNHLKDGMW